MSYFIVDTNVPVIADGGFISAPPECIENCIEKIIFIKQHGLLLIDDKYLILREYQRNLTKRGQQGLGFAFFKWVHENQNNSLFCLQVNITSKDGDEDFVEFPKDPKLKKFDRSDKKFVAVALASRKKPDILVAIERGWRNYSETLRKNGLSILFLCPPLIGKTRP